MIHICFCVNNAYVKHMAATMASICEHHVSSEVLHFWVLTDDISDENAQKLEHFLQKYQAKLTILRLRAADYDYSGIPHLSPFARYVLFRLEITRFIDLPRILYLDVDMIFMSDIAELWHVSLQNAIAGAVMQVPPQSFPDRDNPYYNGGLLLIQTEKWRENQVSEKILYELRHRPHFGFLEQDMLNLLFSTKIRALPSGWNVLNFWDTKQVVKNFHFAGMKPWRKESVNPYNVFYFDHLQKTPFYDENDAKLHAHAKRIAKIPRFLSIFIDKYLYLNLYFCKQFLFRLFSQK